MFSFPSPCGDVVLKLSRISLKRWVVTVSVPLRGCGFEITLSLNLTGRSVIVSVPLRGCGFEIFFRRDGSPAYSYEFPSPCGDVVLKSKSIRLDQYKKLLFPSPCGDVVLKSLRLEALLCLVQNGTLRRGSVSPPFCVGDVF